MITDWLLKLGRFEQVIAGISLLLVLICIPMILLTYRQFKPKK